MKSLICNKVIIHHNIDSHFLIIFLNINYYSPNKRMSEKFWSNIIRYYTNEVPSDVSCGEAALRRSLRFALTPVP